MKFSSKLGLLILLCSGVFTNSFYFAINGSMSSEFLNLKIKKSVYESHDYIWIWDEFEGAPGDLEGNDIEHWGPSLGPYHNRTELWDKLESLERNFPSLVDLDTIGFSFQGALIPVIRLTDESINTYKKEFFIVAHHHARETITVENALYYIDRMIHDFILGDSEIEEIFSTREIYIIPSLNIDSLDIIHLMPSLRKNLRPVDEDGDGTSDEVEILYGVDTFDPDETIGEDLPGGIDLNRNYPYQWDYPYGNSAVNSSLVYRGEYPLSEPETNALANFVRKHYFQAAVSLHSGIKLIIVPWGYDPNVACPDEAIYQTLGLKLKDETGLAFEPLYPAAGVWDDWMYGARGIIAVTIETYSGIGPDWQYIWDGFNPHANAVIANCENVVYPGLLYMTTYDRPELAIEPTENITSVIPVITEETSLKIGLIPYFIICCIPIILIKRRKK